MFSLKQGNLKTKLFKLCFLLFLIMMLIFPTAALSGAKRGLLLWFNTVLPTLLPFIIVSTIIVRLNIASSLCKLLHPVIGKLFRVSKNACYPIIIGFLSGIPMGAKTSADLIRDKKINVHEGQFLTIMCNNASPMFVLGYIALNELQLPNLKLTLILILYGSSILTACIFRHFYSFFTGETYSTKIEKNSSINQNSLVLHAQSVDTQTTRSRFHFDFSIVDDAIMDGFDVITKIGGYIILFSILAQVILSFEQISSLVRMIIVGIFEITTGVNTIAGSSLEMNTKIVLILTITSFGGFSGVAQTKSVFADSGLSIRSYMKAKVLNACITLCLTLLYVALIF